LNKEFFERCYACWHFLSEGYRGGQELSVRSPQELFFQLHLVLWHGQTKRTGGQNTVSTIWAAWMLNGNYHYKVQMIIEIP
jgi:hypothetical protein